MECSRAAALARERTITYILKNELLVRFAHHTALYQPMHRVVSDRSCCHGIEEWGARNYSLSRCLKVLSFQIVSEEFFDLVFILTRLKFNHGIVVS